MKVMEGMIARIDQNEDILSKYHCLPAEKDPLIYYDYCDKIPFFIPFSHVSESL